MTGQTTHLGNGDVLLKFQVDGLRMGTHHRYADAGGSDVDLSEQRSGARGIELKLEGWGAEMCTPGALTGSARQLCGAEEAPHMLCRQNRAR